MNKTTQETIHFDHPSSIFFNGTATTEIYPPHWHNAAEFTVALKDGCKYKVGDTLYKLNAGDILLAWPGQIHETVKIPKRGAMFIQFASIIIENNMDLLSVSRFLYDCNYISAQEEPALAEFIADRIFEIDRIRKSNDLFAESRSKGCVYEILVRIGEHVMSDSRAIIESEDTSKIGWQYIHAACNYISENSSNPITQTEVADHIGISTFYFSKLFKQYMHISFPAYLSNIRVKAATSLLLDKGLSITDCAFMAGFQSTTTFNKVFREITGYSPRNYRKLYR